MERYALKYNEEFLVADALGDITGDGDGLFHDDTRLLSRVQPERRRRGALAAELRRQPGQRLLPRQRDQSAAAGARRRARRPKA